MSNKLTSDEAREAREKLKVRPLAEVRDELPGGRKRRGPRRVAEDVADPAPDFSAPKTREEALLGVARALAENLGYAEMFIPHSDHAAKARAKQALTDFAVIEKGA